MQSIREIVEEMVRDPKSMERFTGPEKRPHDPVRRAWAMRFNLTERQQADLRPCELYARRSGAS
jgi:hypothetical protein